MSRTLFFTLFLIAPAWGVQRELDSARLFIEVTPRKMVQGGASLLRITLVPPRAEGEVIEAAVGETKLSPWACVIKKKPYLCAMVPVGLEQAPGPLSISVSRKQAGSNELVVTSLKVQKRKVKESRLSVDPGITRMSEEDSKRVELEKKELEQIFSTSHPVPLWDKGFRLPGAGGVTSRFGNRRSFNGEVKSVHRGVDLRAPKGTPILSANSGQVVAAKEFFLGGNMVILDHGAGLFTGYAHLSKLEVAPGDRVSKGKRLGLSGATGRVTGPHLHWTMRISGHSIDPLAGKEVLAKVWPQTP